MGGIEHNYDVTVKTKVRKTITVPDGAMDRFLKTRVRLIFEVLLAADRKSIPRLESDLYGEEESVILEAARTLTEYWNRAEAVHSALCEREPGGSGYGS